MDLILRVEVDTDLLLTESPVDVHGVQQNRLVLPSEFGDLTPLAASKSLEDEEKDEGKREIIEEVEARREDGTLPIDPSNPQDGIWKPMSVSRAAL